MKIVLVCLSFYLFLNFVSAFDTFNDQPLNQVIDASNTYHPASHLQELAYKQQVYCHDASITQQQICTINNKNNQVVQQDRSQFQRSKYPPQDPHLHTTQVNPIIVVHPKFRLWLETDRNSETQFSFLKTNISDSNSNISSILNDNIQLNQPDLADGEAIINTPKSTNLL